MANKTSIAAGLSYNVNAFKSGMAQHYKNHELTCSSTDKETNETTQKLPMFSGAPTGTTAAVQSMTEILVKNAIKHTNKDNSGLRTVTRSSLKQSVGLNNDLLQYFNWKLRAFNKRSMYSENVPVSSKELNAVVDKINANIKFTPKALNLLNYMLSEVYIDIIHTAYEFMTFAGKRTVTNDAVVWAVRNKFPDNLAHELVTEINRAVAASGGEEVHADNEDHDQEADGDSSNSDSDHEEDAEQSKSASTSTTSKSAKKTPAKAKASAKVTQIDEDASDASDDEDADDHSDEEVKVTAKPKKAAPAKGAAKKDKGRTVRKATK